MTAIKMSGKLVTASGQSTGSVVRHCRRELTVAHPLDLVEIGLVSAEEARELHELETAAAAK